MSSKDVRRCEICGGYDNFTMPIPVRNICPKCFTKIVEYRASEGVKIKKQIVVRGKRSIIYFSDGTMAIGRNEIGRCDLCGKRDFMFFQSHVYVCPKCVVKLGRLHKDMRTGEL